MAYATRETRHKDSLGKIWNAFANIFLGKKGPGKGALVVTREQHSRRDIENTQA